MIGAPPLSNEAGIFEGQEDSEWMDCEEHSRGMLWKLILLPSIEKEVDLEDLSKTQCAWTAT